MIDFDSYKQKIATMNKQAAQLDRARGEYHDFLFDQQLFQSQSHFLQPCVQELQSTLTTLQREYQAKKLTVERAQYLSEKLFAQHSAISRELATSTIRTREIKPTHLKQKPLNAIYQDLAQHQQWRQRLKEMVRDQTFQVERTSLSEQTAAQKRLLAMEQRLARCEAAIVKIENQISYREKNQS